MFNFLKKFCAKNPVAWFEIYVNDMERATAFYEKLFQVKLEHLPDDEILMMSFPMNYFKYGASGALVKMTGVEAGGNSTMVYFSSKDCAVEESRVVECGGKVIRPKFDIGKYGFVTILEDSEGNTIGVHSRK